MMSQERRNKPDKILRLGKYEYRSSSTTQWSFQLSQSAPVFTLFPTEFSHFGSGKVLIFSNEHSETQSVWAENLGTTRKFSMKR
jgi:hypothetical protein